jgi:hypothetical protein
LKMANYTRLFFVSDQSRGREFYSVKRDVWVGSREPDLRYIGLGA